MGVNPKIIKEITEGVLSGASGIIEALPSTEKKSQLKNELTKIVTESLNKSDSLKAEVLKTEMNGNWLQRSWRPIIMLSFGFVILSIYFILPVIDIWIDEPDLTKFYRGFKDHQGFWDLVYIGMGGFIAGRSVEKVATTVTKNIDLPFVRKKDRKNIIDADDRS